jgi:hypothetical protein
MATVKYTFWDKYKVFILGLLGSIALVLQEFIGQPDVDYKVILFAAFLGALSYIATAWRGQGLTIIGIIGTLANAFITVNATGNFTWTQFVLSAIVAIITASAPDPKPRGYEATDLIKEAKNEGQHINDKAYKSNIKI